MPREALQPDGKRVMHIEVHLPEALAVDLTRAPGRGSWRTRCYAGKIVHRGGIDARPRGQRIIAEIADSSSRRSRGRDSSGTAPASRSRPARP